MGWWQDKVEEKYINRHLGSLCQHKFFSRKVTWENCSKCENCVRQKKEGTIVCKGDLK